jgi:hypothetical protein
VLGVSSVWVAWVQVDPTSHLELENQNLVNGAGGQRIGSNTGTMEPNSLDKLGATGIASRTL